ncbi:MAG: hypothetical protein FWE22_00015 [Firmicutes bacterium]|nr:hypothetical protein [Bacillota bacterium]
MKKIQKVKISLAILIVLVMVFSVFGVVACNNDYTPTQRHALTIHTPGAGVGGFYVRTGAGENTKVLQTGHTVDAGEQVRIYWNETSVAEGYSAVLHINGTPVKDSKSPHTVTVNAAKTIEVKVVADSVDKTPAQFINTVVEQRAPSTKFYEVVDYTIKGDTLDVEASKEATQVTINFNRIDGMLGENFVLTSGTTTIHAYEMNAQRHFRRYGTEGEWSQTRPTAAMFVYDGYFGNDFYLVVGAFERTLTLNFKGHNGATRTITVNITIAD